MHDSQDAFYNILLVRDANSGRIEGKFRFPRNAELYGVWWHEEEIIAESPYQTWHFEPRTLHLVSTQRQHRTQTWSWRKQAYCDLCPDGQTLHCMRLYTREYIDLRTGKTLWKESNDSRKGGENTVGYSANGRTVLMHKDKDVIARDTRTGKEQWRLRGLQSSVIALAPDQSAIYEARQNGELWKWPRP